MTHLSDEINIDDLNTDEIMAASSLNMILDNMLFLSPLMLQHEAQDKNNDKMSITNESARKLDNVQSHIIAMSNKKVAQDKKKASMKKTLLQILDTSIQEAHKQVAKKSHKSNDKQNLNTVMKELLDNNISLKNKAAIKKHITTML